MESTPPRRTNRHVAWHLRLALLFGGLGAQFGWAFVALPQVHIVSSSRELRWEHLVLLIFVGAGLALAIPSLRRGERAIELLRTGTVARGRLVDRESGWINVQGRQQEVLTFEFVTPDGSQHRCKVRTFGAHALSDDEDEVLVYDPRRPRRAVTLDHLSGWPKISGDTIASSPLSALSVIAPLVAVGMTLASLAHVLHFSP